MSIHIQPISSLYKIRTLSDIPEESLTHQTLLRGEHFAFQLALHADENRICTLSACLVDDTGKEFTDFIHLFRIENVIMDMPVYPDHDDDILTDQPGLMPDLLRPLEATQGRVRAASYPVSVLVSMDTPKDLQPGAYCLKLTVSSFDTEAPSVPAIEERTVAIDLLSAVLPEQSVRFTQWFHVDSIAEAYHVPVYSEAHWALIDRYMATARYLGIDTILTPMLTPPLDTMMGGERPKVQLVRIEKEGETYRFDFTLAKRFLALAQKNGMTHFEISHLYSQWGLIAAPNIYVWENGTEALKFGWNTKAQEPDYRNFLSQFVPAMVAFLDSLGILDRCFFHLSDEPHKEHLENYKAAHDLVKPLLRGRPILDAISDVDFYQHGLIDLPVTASNHMKPFLQEQIPQQWTYYCCGQYQGVGNRFLCFPGYRNRILGLQLFKFSIKGFLQWGYNFYHAERSAYVIDPYQTTSADLTFPAGDPFSVYPGKDGPLMTLRALVFKDALQDVEVLKTLEAKTSHDHVVSLLEQIAGMELAFDVYPRNYTYLPAVLEAVKQELA